MSINLCFKSGNRYDKHGNPLESFVEFDVWSTDKQAIEKILAKHSPALEGHYTMELHSVRYTIRIDYIYAARTNFALLLKEFYDLQGG